MSLLLNRTWFWSLLLSLVSSHTFGSIHVERAESYGYISDISSERGALQPVQLDLPFNPYGEIRDWQSQIFNHQLTREFELRYEEKFGRTQAEQSVTFSTAGAQSFQTLDGTAATNIQVTDAQKSFGNYMVNRLTEYHFDIFMKSSKSMAEVYKLKERLSKVEVEVRPGYSFQANYSLSGNLMDLNFKNPVVGSRAVYDFGRDEITLSLSKGLSRTVSLENHILFKDGTNKFIVNKQIGPLLATNVLFWSNFLPDGRTPRQNLTLLGLRYKF